jgi:hypothetical protein
MQRVTASSATANVESGVPVHTSTTSDRSACSTGSISMSMRPVYPWVTLYAAIVPGLRHAELGKNTLDKLPSKCWPV